MKTQPSSHRKSAGFTLVEMIGVLAVIAILASMLVPRVFQAISDSKVNNAATSLNSLKAAVNEYYGKYGRFGQTNGVVFASLPVNNWELTLLAEGIIEKPFAVRIGDGVVGGVSGSRITVVAPAALATTAAATNSAYCFDGTATVNQATGSMLVEAVIPGVDPKDAKDLNDRLDGTALGAVLLLADTIGRVKYGVPNAAGTVDVHVYLAHK